MCRGQSESTQCFEMIDIEADQERASEGWGVGNVERGNLLSPVIGVQCVNLVTPGHGISGSNKVRTEL